MVRALHTLWWETEKIYGAFDVKEAQVMYDIITRLPTKSVIVEIGSYCGKSSSLLGQLATDLDLDFYCVDPFITAAPGYESPQLYQEKVHKLFMENMARVNAKYTLLNMTSKKAAKNFKKEIDFMFIDGDHRYEGIKLDCDLWLPKLKKDHHVLFDDYGSSWIGVKQAVDERKDVRILYPIDNSVLAVKV